MESLSRLLRGYEPAAGNPVPLAALYAANTRTAAEFIRESKRIELQSRARYAEYQRALREDMAAAEYAAAGGE